MVDVWAPGRRARSAVGADPLGFERTQGSIRHRESAPSGRLIAEALGFHHTTTQRQRANAAGTWVRYPGRDHIK
jgi:hypothetical protein